MAVRASEEGVGCDVDGYSISFWGDQNTLNLGQGDGCTTCKHALKPT